MTESLLPYLRRADPDRYFCVLFAPPALREPLCALYALDHEIARASAVVSQPALAYIRLQWWREVAEGARRRHEVATPLGEALDAGLLRAADLVAIIDAREAEADPAFESVEDWRSWLLAADGGVAVAAARLLGANEPEAFAGRGAAFGAARALSRGDPRFLPAEAATLEAIASGWSRQPARIERIARVAALPSVFAGRDLRRGPRPRGLGDKLAVITAFATGLA